MNKSVYLELLILELSKTLMYEFCYNYVKPKCGEKVKLCYMDTDSFFVSIKTDDIYKDIAENVETRFHTWIINYIDHYLNEKNKQIIGLMKNELLD